MNSNKLLLVTSEFPPQPGGLGNHAYNVAKQLSHRNFDVTVLADYRTDKHTEENNFDAAQNFEVLRIKRYKFILRTYLSRIAAFRKYIKRNQPRSVMASGKFPLWILAFGIRQSCIKKIAVIHGSEVNLKVAWQRKLVDNALKRFDQVIAVSNYTKSLVSRLKLKQITVIANGFEIDKFQNSSSNEEIKGNPALVTVGNVSQRKGQHNVIHKLPALIEIYPKIQYHIVGTPSEKEEFLRLAMDLKVENYITFYGIVNQSRLNFILSKSDIFVMLSELTSTGDLEGFGIAILEANYLGLPAIGSLNCGIEDAINNYKSGILTPFDDTKAFCIALKEILKNKTVYSENARKWALEHTWERSIENYIKLITSK